jgi:flagellar biosynthesis protein FlhF
MTGGAMTGGRVAFVGATGVGKTTTLAKIAVRWVLRHGARDLALVAADSVRIGAQDQLQSLGQLLGAPVYVPDDFNGLGALLTQLARFRLILIDTPGASVRDPQLAARLAVLANSASQLESALILPANSQAGALEEAVKRFAPANPASCVLTKLDEAASLGGALSVVIRARLPIAFVSEGQRIPEDLSPARALDLVSAAVRLAKTSNATADEDLLRRRFGKVSHGIT